MHFLSNRFPHFVPTSCGAIPKRRIFLACVLPFSFCAMAQAHPLDSSDIVYIDGSPCNSACQSYMAWSRKTLNHGRAGSEKLPTRSAKTTARPEGGTATDRSKPVGLAHAARPVVPLPREAPQRMANLPHADDTSVADAKAARAGLPTISIDEANEQRMPATAVPAAPTAMPSGQSSTASAGPERTYLQQAGSSERTDTLPANDDTLVNSDVRTSPQQISANTAREEKVAAVTTGAMQEQQGSNMGGASSRVEREEPREAERAPVPPSNRIDGTTSLALAVPEINSASDSAAKAVAGEAKQIELPVTFSRPPPVTTKKAGLSDNDTAGALAWLAGLRQLFSPF